METVLLIDDSNFMRTLIKNIVVKQGLTVIGEAENGVIGTELYKELNPDFVILDMIMDEKDGLTTLEQILEYNPDAVVFAVSSMLGQKYYAEKATSLGAKEIMTKPIDVRKFKAALRKYSKHPHFDESSQSVKKFLSEDDWQELLVIFRRETEKAITTMRETVSSGNLKLFTITAHSMKSMLANNDEFELSDMAHLLEVAGQDGNTDYISENLEDFIEALDRVAKAHT